MENKTGPEIFLSHLAPASRVLVPGCSDGAFAFQMARQGHEVLGIDRAAAPENHPSRLGVRFETRDIRLFSPTPESWDGIYCHRLISYLNAEEVRRVLMIFFQALKPKTGVLFLSHLLADGSSEAMTHGKKGERYFAYDSEAFQSLLRQSGFSTELKGKQGFQNQDWNAYVCRRIS